jgi:hypothetical protein
MKKNTHFIVLGSRFRLQESSKEFLSCYQFNTRVAKVSRVRLNVEKLVRLTLFSEFCSCGLHNTLSAYSA